MKGLKKRQCCICNNVWYSEEHECPKCKEKQYIIILK